MQDSGHREFVLNYAIINEMLDGFAYMMNFTLVSKHPVRESDTNNIRLGQGGLSLHRTTSLRYYLNISKFKQSSDLKM